MPGKKYVRRPYLARVAASATCPRRAASKIDAAEFVRFRIAATTSRLCDARREDADEHAQPPTRFHNPRPGRRFLRPVSTTVPGRVRCSNPTAGAPGSSNGRGSGDFDWCRVGNGDRVQQHKQRLAGVPVGLAILRIPAALGTAGIARAKSRREVRNPSNPSAAFGGEGT